jgi:hypothetical protein
VEGRAPPSCRRVRPRDCSNTTFAHLDGPAHRGSQSERTICSTALEARHIGSGRRVGAAWSTLRNLLAFGLFGVAIRHTSGASRAPSIALVGKTVVVVVVVVAVGASALGWLGDQFEAIGRKTSRRRLAVVSREMATKKASSGRIESEPRARSARSGPFHSGLCLCAIVNLPFAAARQPSWPVSRRSPDAAGPKQLPVASRRADVRCVLCHHFRRRDRRRRRRHRNEPPLMGQQ